MRGRNLNFGISPAVHASMATSAAAVPSIRMAPLEASNADLSPEQLAAAREARNGSCSELLGTLGHVPDADAAVLGEMSVAAVWRLRRVSRAFRGWCGSALAAMPRVVAVGGRQQIGDFGATTPGGARHAVSLDLATLALGCGGTVPDLPTPRKEFSLGQLLGGRLVAAGGSTHAATAAAFEWVLGRPAWTPLPPMGSRRANAVPAVLSDGRMLMAGGCDDGNQVLASAEVLAADGSGWAALPPMATTRYGAVAGRLPGGQVIVAGGLNDNGVLLASAELWDSATGAWAALPPMAQARHRAVGCVLPSGRFAVLGGYGMAGWREDAEAFDPVSWAWQPLPPMPDYLVEGAAVAVAGGLLGVGGAGDTDAMLFEEASGRWFTLPGQVPAGRNGHRLATVPAP
jgi:hypothetical protein